MRGGPWTTWRPTKETRMEASEWTPRAAGTDPALVDLMVERQGPFASVYLPTPGAVENASQRIQLAWKSVRETLAMQGAPEGSLAAIDPLVPDAHTRGDCLAVFANASGILHDESGHGVAMHERSALAPLPALLPLIRWRQDQPSFVVVLADRTGADLFGIRLEGPAIEHEVEGVGGPVRKVAPGGWSQRRYQQRAENTWEKNAHQVAAEAAELADRIDAELIVVGGDGREVALVLDSLPEHLRDAVATVDGGRQPDGADDAGMPASVDAAVAEHAARATEALVDRFHM